MHRLQRLGVLAGTVGLALGALAMTTQPAGAGPPGGTVERTSIYIVQVDPAAGPVADVVGRAVAPLGGSVDQVFTKAINGAVVTLPVPALGALLDVPGIVD